MGREKGEEGGGRREEERGGEKRERTYPKQVNHLAQNAGPSFWIGLGQNLRLDPITNAIEPTSTTINSRS
jgi:hypothetical protein